MAYSKKNYTGDGVTKLFTVTFPYIDPSHVTVLVNGLAVPYSFQSKQVIEIATAPGSGSLIQLSRNSNPESRLVDFQDDSMGTEEVFNLNSDQLLFLAQEAMDKTLEGTVVEQVQEIADAALASAVLAATKASEAAASAAAIALPISVASGGTGGTTQAAARTGLGLGTASTKDVGVSPGNVVEVQPEGKLPSLDGSGLTNIRRIIQDFPGVTSGVATGTALIPYDDTLPQLTEGWPVATRVITPTAIGNKIIVEALVSLSSSVAGVVTVALFRDVVTDALAASGSTVAAAAITQVPLRFELPVTSLSPITFWLRVGASAAGTLTLNGAGGTSRFGGALVSYMRVTEVKV